MLSNGGRGNDYIQEQKQGYDSGDEQGGVYEAGSTPKVKNINHIISIIAIHQYRLRCFLNMLGGETTKSFQNAAILKLIVDPTKGVTLSLEDQGDNMSDNPNKFYQAEGILYKEGFDKIEQPQNSQNVYIFYLVRHGQAYHNVLKQRIKEANGPLKKIPKRLKKIKYAMTGKEGELSDLGKRQARHAGEKLSGYADIKNAETIKYFVSDLLRTRQTMGEILFKMDKTNETMIVLPCSHEINRSKYPCDVNVTLNPMKFVSAKAKAFFQPENKSKCSPHILHLSLKDNREDAQSIAAASAAASAAATGTGLNIDCNTVVVDGGDYVEKVRDLTWDQNRNNNTKTYMVNWDLYKDKSGRTRCGSTNFINIAIEYLNKHGPKDNIYTGETKSGGGQTLKKRSKKRSKKRRKKRSMEKRSKKKRKRSKKRRTRKY